MTLDEFIEEYSGAAFDDADLAEVASEVDDEDLHDIVNRFLSARSDFLSFIDSCGFERG